jgi:hypothetical protein
MRASEHEGLIMSGLARNASLVVSGVVGAFLLFLYLEDREQPPRPPIDPKPVVEKTEVPNPPEKTPVAVAAVHLPPPPAPAVEQPKPEPAKVVKPLAPQPPAPEPAPQVKPLRPAPRKLEPTRTIETLRPEPKKAHTPEPPQVVKALRPKPRPKAEPIPEPVSVKAEEPPVKVKPMQPKPEPRPVRETKPVPQEKTVKVSVTNGGQVAKEGRTLLRLLEHGSGPGIEISWPRNAGGRRDLYRLLNGCYGMRTVLMDTDGGLYATEGERGRPWDINLDRFSGFVRQPNGFIDGDERRQGDTIRRYHGLARRANLVRLFPRRVDAVLLGGLRSVLGERYTAAKSIRAEYRQVGSGLFIENIVADGERAPGRIAFSPVSRRGCPVGAI